jgi:hypothetical protein
VPNIWKGPRCIATCPGKRNDLVWHVMRQNRHQRWHYIIPLLPCQHTNTNIPMYQCTCAPTCSTSCRRGPCLCARAFARVADLSDINVHIFFCALYCLHEVKTTHKCD